MHGRGTDAGIYIGIVIAVVSGIGVALSILSNNANSLVGVAISASLLPPAVNCGMLWGIAALGPSLVDAQYLYDQVYHGRLMYVIREIR